MVTYGGDEVGALVIDMGHHTTRAGHAGEDTPKVVVPTSIGLFSDNSGDSIKKTWYIGDSALWKPKNNLRVTNPYAGATVGSPSKSSSSSPVLPGGNIMTSPTATNDAIFEGQQGKIYQCVLYVV